METENDILEETLSIAEDGYDLAYNFLIKNMKKTLKCMDHRRYIFLHV